MDYQTGDILHCRSYGLLGTLIRKFTKSEFNHSAIFIEVWGQPYIMDAQKDGTNLRPFEEWKRVYDYDYIVHRKELSELRKRDLAKRALSKSGHTGYDFISLIIKHPIQLITGKWKYKGDRETEKMFCSEFVSWCHEIGSSYRMSPGDLYKYCIENKYNEITRNFL